MCSSVAAIYSRARVVMKQAASFNRFKAAMVRQGTMINTCPDDYNTFKTPQMLIFDGKYLAPVGTPIGN
jgi:hypothetical protein